MVNSISSYVNPKLAIVGKDDKNNNRIVYSMSGEKFSVADYDKTRFEVTANNYLNAKDKYYQTKSEHPIETSIRSIARLVLLGAGTVFAALGGSKLAGKCSKGIKNAAAVAAGFVGFALTSAFTKGLNTPGLNEMNENAKKMKTIDMCKA